MPASRKSQGNWTSKGLSIAHLSKEFVNGSNRRLVLNDFSLRVREGEFVCLFGPNGCGKSTLLHLLAGLDSYEEGTVRIHGKPPGMARAGLVFQDYHASLFPWRTLEGNVAYALECRGVKEEAISYLKDVGLEKDAQRFPYEISGGMRQRVSIARALAFQPDLLLLDEPFSALDFETRLTMEEELLSVWSEKRITTLCVSHDVDESVFLADRVVILSERPARIKGVVPVSLARPRTAETRRTKKFFDLRNQVISLFLSEG